MKTPRPYQIEAAKALFNAVVSDPGCHPIAAIPTGSGKTVVMSEFIDEYLTHNPFGKVLVLSHVKEILDQNYRTLAEHFDGFDIGLYSAGLDSRTISQITVAGIQSVYRSHNKFKGTNVVIIDECHLVNTKDAGMYRSFLSKLDANYVGLTATPFRTGHGYVHKGEEALFNELVYNLCTIDGYHMLIENGWLCPLVAKGTNMKLSTDGLATRMNEYVTEEMSKRFDRESITNKAVDEIIEYGEPYKKWLVFAIDIKHAEHVADAFNERGIPTACVHSKMDEDRDRLISDFKAGKYRCMVNVDILTTGFDAPDIDLIGMLRPTQSPILHIQTLGRGMRIAPNKDHCLVLDFAGNVMRLGPINDVQIRQKEEGKGGGSPMVKECPECQGYLPIAVMSCTYCGYEYPVKEKIMPTASTAEIIRQKNPVKVGWHNIRQIWYQVHSKPGKPDMMKVTYSTETNKVFKEYVCYEHEGYAGHKARHWVKFRWNNNSGVYPATTKMLVEAANNKCLKQPKSILVDESDKFPSIRDVRF